jgi:hypothetical protein
MGVRGSTSRKGSGASCESTKPRDLVFFADRCLGSKTVPDALRANGDTVEVMSDHFDQDVLDKVWVPAVGAKGWIILSKDRYLRHNAIEIVALLRSNTHSFLLTSGNYTGQEMAAAFIAAMSNIKQIVLRIPAPLVGTVTRNGSVKIIYTHDDLIERASQPPRIR